MYNPFDITRNFEAAISEYTGAPNVVCVSSCTMALLLCCKYLKVETVSIPKHTYCSVPMSIIHAGGKVTFRDEAWTGQYRLLPYPIFDAAKRFTSGMYQGGFQCVSFHVNKPLGIEQGGAILHSDAEADKWFRKMRFDGRTEGVASKDDMFDLIGYHCYMNLTTAAMGLLRLHFLPKDNPDFPPDAYPDLSKFPVFTR